MFKKLKLMHKKVHIMWYIVGAVIIINVCDILTRHDAGSFPYNDKNYGQIRQCH